jgi:hypothetical protein
MRGLAMGSSGAPSIYDDDSPKGSLYYLAEDGNLVTMVYVDRDGTFYNRFFTSSPFKKGWNFLYYPTYTPSSSLPTGGKWCVLPEVQDEGDS